MKKSFKETNVARWMFLAWVLLMRDISGRIEERWVVIAVGGRREVFILESSVAGQTARVFSFLLMR